MTEAELVALLKQHLQTTAGGYLRNPLRPFAITCDACSGPVDDAYSTCFKCAMVFGQDVRCAQHVASMTYAVQGQQGGHMMYAYKAKPKPVREHVTNVGSLMWVGLSHRACIGKLTGQPVTAWATVPSLPSKPGQHPMNRLITQHPSFDLPEIVLSAAAQVRDPRGFEPSNFIAVTSPAGHHVLLLEDTWASGGHAQSAAAALVDAGAARVSILTAARWLNPARQGTPEFIRDYWNHRPYDPNLCPWTGFACP